MPGIIGSGQAYADEAMTGLEHASELETRRETQTKQNKASRVQGEASMAGTGAAVGAEVGGPWGAVIGGAVGLVAGALM